MVYGTTPKITGLTEKGILKFRAIKPEEKYAIEENIFELRFRSYPKRHVGKIYIRDNKTGQRDLNTIFTPSTSIFFRVTDKWKMWKLAMALFLLIAEISLGIALWFPEKAGVLIDLPPTVFQIIGTLSLLFVWPTIEYLYKIHTTV
jgi:hypothetical protein